MKKIFIICTVRNATPEYIERLEAYVSKLEELGNDVYAPHRDTDQQMMGYDICSHNFEAMKNAEEVHIFYNPNSQGTHFDMGMAFALGKKITIVENEPLTEGKSFQRMLVEWQEHDKDNRIEVYKHDECLYEYCPQPASCMTTESGCVYVSSVRKY